jgi:hypothetical protein
MSHHVKYLCLMLCILLALTVPTFGAENPTPSEAQLAANAVQALLDQQLSSFQGSLTALATSSEVQSLDWDAMQQLLSTFQDYCPPCVIWYSEPDGTYYTVPDGLADQSLADRGYFQPLMGGEDILGEVVVSKSTGELSAIVAVPIYKNDQVVGALGASVFIEDMAKDLAASLLLPAEMSLLVATADGQAVFTNPAEAPQWMEDLATAEFEDTANLAEIDLGDKVLTVIHQVSAFNDWRYIIAIPSE